MVDQKDIIKILLIFCPIISPTLYFRRTMLDW